MNSLQSDKVNVIYFFVNPQGNAEINSAIPL
jgi:basic membrane lipoprotein Med (substrate-binding protein (PBP1-ABC) superfamily)